MRPEWPTESPKSRFAAAGARAAAALAPDVLEDHMRLAELLLDSGDIAGALMYCAIAAPMAPAGKIELAIGLARALMTAGLSGDTVSVCLAADRAGAVRPPDRERLRAALAFNGMNTPIAAFSVGTPVVTLPTGLQRGRFTQAMYRTMGIDWGGERSDLLFEVARDVAEYEQFFLAVHREATVRSA